MLCDSSAKKLACTNGGVEISAFSYVFICCVVSIFAIKPLTHIVTKFHFCTSHIASTAQAVYPFQKPLHQSFESQQSFVKAPHHTRFYILLYTNLRYRPRVSHKYLYFQH